VLTVLLTTHNGSGTFLDALEAFCQLEKPSGGWKLVIVDNASTDQTKEIARSFRQRLPMTVVYEPRRGQNVARNSGLKLITGDLVVFSDDDVLPRSDWLVSMRELADSKPTFSIFGGNILPKWEIPPPDWLRNLEWPYKGVTFALVNPTLEEGPVQPDYVVSPNMAIRADLFRAGHRFDVTIGPDGSDNYPMGSETEFIDRMSRAGHRLWHCKCAVVYHMIRSHQMTRDWMLRRAVRFGRGKYRIWAMGTLNSPALRRIARYFIRQAIIRVQIALQTARVEIAERRGDREKILRERWWLNYYTGKAIESRSLGPRRLALQASRPE
jgi:glycosyltransferase involved in cell wall biosynthesis